MPADRTPSPPPGDAATLEIGAAARASGVSAKMIRHYESIGLVPPATRSAGNYRVYGPRDVHTLRFIRRARDLGFTIAQVRTLLALWQDRERASADVKALALEHVAGIDARIAELQRMRDTLTHLAERCHGDARPDCPILGGLAERSAEAPEPPYDAKRTHSPCKTR